MKLIIALINIMAYSSAIFSQSGFDSILSVVEKNNITLLALRKSVEAEKIENKTGIYLQNPEIGFNYLWGDLSIGNRTDLSITQSFDFPAVYRNKNQISNIRNEQAELEYVKQLKYLQLQTRLVCCDLVYSNALSSELARRLKHAQSIADSYKSKLDVGETNILEYNKALLNLLNRNKEFDLLEIERTALLSELTSLNGGVFIDFIDKVFYSPKLPVDFEQWFEMAEQNNPILNWLNKEIEISLKQEKLKRALTWPKFQAGYMSEKNVGEQFQGLTIGVSIPLWENKNTVKHAKANTLAWEGIAADNKMQFYNQLKALHTKAVSLQKNTNDYRLKLAEFDNSALLKKALDQGEITLIDFILELAIYYESVNNLLELEREMNKTLAELNQYL